MASRPPPLLVAVIVLLLGAVVGVLLWLPFDPFEGPAGPLDQLVPDDVDAVVRFDPTGVRSSAAALTLWEHPVVQELVAASGVRERVLAPIEALQERLGRATLGLAPRLEDDVVGQDVVVALRGADVLLLSRVTGRARTLELARKLGASELQAAGIALDGDVAVFSRDDAPTVYLRRHRDVLAIATARGLVEGVAVLGDLAAEHGPRQTPFGEALDSRRPAGSRILLWVRPEAFAGAQGSRRGRNAPEGDGAGSDGAGSDGGGNDGSGGVLGLWARLVPPRALAAIRGTIDTTAADRVTIQLGSEYLGDVPESMAAVRDATSDDASTLHEFARSLAVPGETIVSTGLAVRAEDCVRTLVTSQPESRRQLIEEILADQGVTVDALARGLAEHLRDGVAAVVARLEEADEIELDDASGGVVLPIPATLVALRLRSPAGAADIEARLRADARALFGAEIVPVPDELPTGGRLYRPLEHGFGGEWALLRPAFAITDGWLIVCTNEAFLQRALAWRMLGEPESGSETGAAVARTAAFRIDGGPLRAYVDDQRWAWADRVTYHDWKAERQAIRDQLDRERSILSPEDRRIYEDARIDLRLAARKNEEFPAAIARYRAMWRPLEALGEIRASASVEGRRISLRLDLRPVR